MSFVNELEKKLKVTITLLNEARMMLTELEGVNKYVAQYEVHLHQNEFEIALDMLEKAALHTTSSVPAIVWLKLKESADSMGLKKQSEFYAQKLPGT